MARSIDDCWDYGDPAGSEARLRAWLADHVDDVEQAAEARTQVARSLVLQKRFGEGHTELDAVEAVLGDLPDRVRARYHLERSYPREAKIIEWLAENTKPSSVIFYRGPQKGVVEFLPALLFPRLIVRQPEGLIPEKIAGRMVARGKLERAGVGIFVLVTDGSGFKLETL